MFWIDKHNRGRRGRGHRIVNDFLRKAWYVQGGKYVNCDYASFKRDRRMEQLLHQEQGGFCCYCMRHLEIGEHPSLEHVMPHHCTNKCGKVNYKLINYYKRFNKNYTYSYKYKYKPSNETKNMQSKFMENLPK